MVKIHWSEPKGYETWSERSPMIYVDRRSGERSVLWPNSWSMWQRLAWRFRHWEWSRGT